MKPIIFSTEMVRAILESRKTQTRRVIKPQPDDDGYISAMTNRGEPSKVFVHDKGLAPHQPGNILWVRETWSHSRYPNTFEPLPQFIYKADFGERALEAYRYHWRPSIHMPKEAARLFLRVTGVRVERVRDISDEDAIAEGINTDDGDMHCPICEGVGSVSCCVGGGASFDDCPECRTAKGRYGHLWDSLNVKRGYGWDANPWVWVYEFERISREEAKPWL